MHAPPTGLSVFVDTPQFKRWFRGSKVVDERGDPMVVYHGTYSDFDTFRPKKRKPDLGFHFGSISQAEFFAGYMSNANRPPFGCVMPVYLRIENPLRMPDYFERGWQGAENAAVWLYRQSVIDVREGVYKAKSAREAYACIAKALPAAGSDGIVYENVQEGGTATTNQDSYIVFRSEQIKSIFNRGTFDPMSECILE